MTGVIVGVIVVVMVYSLYCCIRAGAMSDRKMRKLCRKERHDADGRSG